MRAEWDDEVPLLHRLQSVAVLEPSVRDVAVEVRHRLLENLEPFRARSLEIHRKLFEEMHPFLTKSLQLQRRLFEETEPLRAAFLRNATRGRQTYSHQLKTLAQNGWFISVWNTPLAWLNPLVTLFTTGQKERANHRLRIHFNQQADGIEADLVKTYPKRRVILRKAFRAHRNRDYELCIPVFLAQADGIAREITGIDTLSVYSRSDSKLKRLKQFVDSIVIDELQRDVLELVLMAMPLNVSTGDPILVKRVLNRHEVLHGIETNYASATNSCRSISWLQYVAHFGQAKDFAGRKQRNANIRA